MSISVAPWNDTKEQNLFDSNLVHVGYDVPCAMMEDIFDTYFVPMLKKAFRYAGPDWNGREYTSFVRIKANGRMHTRVILENNNGGAEEAVDVDGQMGDLLWALIHKEENLTWED